MVLGVTFFLVSPIYFFQFLFGLLFPFSIWTFISLFYLEFFVSIQVSIFFLSIYIPYIRGLILDFFQIFLQKRLSL